MISGKDLETTVKKVAKIETIGSEFLTSIIFEAMREVLKEEIKKEIKEVFEKNETAKNLLQKSVKDLIKSKALEARAIIIALEAFLEAGLSALPEDLKKETYQEIANYLYQKFKEIIDHGIK